MFIHPFTDGQLDCFPTLASMKNDAINICVQFFSRHISISLGYIPRSGITQSYVTLCLTYEKLPNYLLKQLHHFIFLHQHCMRVPISPHHHHHLLFAVFLIIAIPLGVKWYFIMVLISIFLMIKDGKHLSMYLLVICMSF